MSLNQTFMTTSIFFKMILVQPTFFSPIIQYIGIANASHIYFEFEDNFQKQTYRNRCYIYTSNGKHLLNVPFQHTKGIKQQTKDVKIDYKDDWHIQHLKTLKTAYNSSPYFEFYIDDLLPIFKTKYKYLLDLNLKSHEFVMDALQLEIPSTKTLEYQKNPDCLDLRNLAEIKPVAKVDFNSYYQIFNENHGFIENLSILDLIFMEGPNALNYLESHSLQLL